MKKRNRIASIVLFLAALLVGLGAEPGWGQWVHFYPNQTDWLQCTIGPDAYGMAVLSDGRVLVTDATGLGYYSSFPSLSDPMPCPPPGGPTYLGNPPDPNLGSLAMGLDGKVYALRGSGTTRDLITVDGYSGTETPVTGGANINAGPLALDPLTGDLYMHGLTAADGNIIYRFSAGSKTQFIILPNLLDGLAWSCDGRYLFAASPTSNLLFRVTRGTAPTYTSATVPGHPDGIVVGAEGTALGGFVFTNNQNGSVTLLNVSPFGSPFTIADRSGFPPERGDFAYVDAQGAMVARLGPMLQRLWPSSQAGATYAGGSFVLPGSTLCTKCAGTAVTVGQVDFGGQACVQDPFVASLILSLSQAACAACQDCYTLNQERGSLVHLLQVYSSDYPCLKALLLNAGSLWNSCPCNCPSSCSEPCRVSGGGEVSQTKFRFGIDLGPYDPVLEAILREMTSF